MNPASFLSHDYNETKSLYFFVAVAFSCAAHVVSGLNHSTQSGLIVTYKVKLPLTTAGLGRKKQGDI